MTLEELVVLVTKALGLGVLFVSASIGIGAVLGIVAGSWVKRR